MVTRLLARSGLALVGLVLLLVHGREVAGASVSDLTLAMGGKSPYRIVVTSGASAPICHAAAELSRFLQQITGAVFPVVTDQVPTGPHEILLGKSTRFTDLQIKVDLTGLGPEGYVLRTWQSRLLLVGSSPRGNLYAVYGLLSDHFGCRWFTPAVSRIPRRSTLALPQVNERKVPAFAYRHLGSQAAKSVEWCLRNRLNGNPGLQNKHGGGVSYGDGFECHTFHRLVPPIKYFDVHPEYFPLVGGKRVYRDAHLCCTNQEVVGICTTGIIQAIQDDPGRSVFSLSIMDSANNWCECASCRDLAQREGSWMAPVLQLVNQVAAAIAPRYPDIKIETLAYHFTRRAPITMKPHPNVIIDLAPSNCCISHPYPSCSHRDAVLFRQDLKAWKALTNNLHVWHYGTNFAHYLLPFPNHKHHADNLRFLQKEGVTGVFFQDVANTPHGELALLDAYLAARFLWDPTCDQDQVIDEFLQEYYGPAATVISQYIDSLDQRARYDHAHMGVWDGPESNFFSTAVLDQWNLFWEEAVCQVHNQPLFLKRVEIARMSVDYLILERARFRVSVDLPMGDLNRLVKIRFSPFFNTLKGSGLTHLAEYTPLNLVSYQTGLLELGIGP